MSAPSIDLAELRARIPLQPLVARRVPLKRSGRQWKGCCPFHSEKTPSFHVYEDGHYHCFGCGAHGDAIDFVQQTEGLDFRAAVNRLAAEAVMVIAPVTGQDRTRQAERLARRKAERERQQAERDRADAAARARRIGLAQQLFAESRPVEGTLAEYYLRTVRGIPLPVAGWPAAIGFHAASRSLIFAGTNALGEVQFTHQVFLTAAGGNLIWQGDRKKKLTNGPRDGAAVRLPGNPDGPLQHAEGGETGLSVWAPTGYETSIRFGALGQQARPERDRLNILLRDDDPAGSGPDVAMQACLDGCRTAGLAIVAATPWPERRGDKSDFNDLVRTPGGPEAVRLRVRHAVLERQGLAPADPPHALPTGTLAQAHSDLVRLIREFQAPMRDDEVDADLPRQWLIAGQGGIGKTDVVGRFLPHWLVTARQAERPARILYLVPEHKVLGAQIADRFTELGLTVYHFQGRGDPFNPKPDDLCQNPDAVREAVRAKQDVFASCCKSKDHECHLYRSCKYPAGLAAAAQADVIIAAHNFVFHSAAKQLTEGVGLVVIDEDFLQHGDWTPELTAETFGSEALQHWPVLRWGQCDTEATAKLAWLHRALRAAIEASPDGYLTWRALREAGLRAEDCEGARRLNRARERAAEMKPGMPLAKRREVAEAAEINGELPRIVACWNAARQILMDGEHGAGRISLRMHVGKRGSARMVTVHTQHEVATWLEDLPVLMIGATTPIADVQRFFPRARLRQPVAVATPYARHELILGGFAKSTLHQSPRKVEALRAYLTVRFMGRELGMVTHLSILDSFAGLPWRVTHHGANAGDDTMRYVDGLAVIDGMRPAAKDVASLAAARTGRAVPVASAEYSTAPVLMRDGSGVAVPVLAYADPDAQAVYSGIHNSSVMQAGGRARAVMRTKGNPVDTLYFGNVAPDVPLDSIINWRDLRIDRLWQMAAACRVYLNAGDMARFHPELFRTYRSAESALERFGDARSRLLREILAVCPVAWSKVQFQPAGQGHRLRVAFFPTADLAAARTEIEAKMGKLVHWSVQPFSAGQEDTAKPVNEGKADLRASSSRLVVQLPVLAPETGSPVSHPPDG